jgi:hypothetical protein
MEKHFRKAALIFLCFFLSIGLYAQDLSPLGVSFKYVPSIPEDEEKVSVNGKFNFNYPVFKTDRSIFLTGLSCKWNHNDIQSDELLYDTRYNVSVPFAMMYTLNSRFKLYTYIEAGISSDRFVVTNETMKYTSNLNLIRNNGDSTKWSLILNLTHQHAGLSISPLFYANIKLYNNLYFNGVLPFKPKVTWKADNKNQISLGVSTESNSFYLPATEFKKYIEDTQADLELSYHRRINKNFKAFGSVGFTFLHKTKVYGDDDRVPVKLYIFDNSNLSSFRVYPDGLVFKIGIYWSTKN